MFNRIKKLLGIVPMYRMELRGNPVEKTHWSCIVHRNGQVLWTSETYISRRNRTDTARRAAKAFKIPMINMEGRTQRPSSSLGPGIWGSSGFCD